MLYPPVGFAHRGAKAYAPENTLEAFDLALRLGATGLESDVWLTSDGVAVLDHDGVVGDRRKKKPINEVTRAELPDHIPTLADLCSRHMAAGYHLSLDVKDPTAGPAVIETVRQHAPALLPQLWLCSPDLQLVASWRSLVPDDTHLVWSTRFEAIRVQPERQVATMRDLGVDTFNMHHTEWNGGLVALFHRFDRLVLAWDVQFEHQLDKLLTMGVDGVFSDWSDRMMEAIAKLPPNPQIRI